MLLVGVDEAGYGPLLGPLVVAGSAFRLRDPPPSLADDALALGAELARALARGEPGETPAPAVGDSKEVYADGGIAALERGVLAFRQAAACGADVAPVSPGRALDAFLRSVGIDPASRQQRPWYAGEPARYPLAGPVGELGAALGRRLERRGLSFVGFHADVLTEGPLNDDFSRTGNKAETLFDATARVLDGLVALARPGERVCAVLDRHGGRKRYGPLVQRGWAGGFVWTLLEEEDASAYRLTHGDRTIDLRFQVRADARAPQVGLASMLAKYLREVFMGLWNDWFSGLCPDVRPTAGYTQDGRRWLDESRPARAAAGIEDAELVRLR